MVVERQFVEKNIQSDASESQRSASHLSFLSVVKGLETNVLQPALSGASVEPINAAVNGLNKLSDLGTHTINKVTGSDYKAPQLSKLSDCETPAAAGSLAELSQRAFHMGGSIIAYALAGRVAGKSLNCLSEAAPAEMQLGQLQIGAVSRAFLNDSRTAMTVGATGLAALRDTKPGETHFSNAASTFVGFSAFAVGNEFLVESGSSALAQASQRFTVGALSGIAQANTSSVILDQKLADKNNTTGTMVASGLLNAILPILNRTEEIAVTEPSVRPMEKSFFSQTLEKIEDEKRLQPPQAVRETVDTGNPTKAQRAERLCRNVREALTRAENNPRLASKPDAVLKVTDASGDTLYRASQVDLQKLLKVSELDPAVAVRLHGELFLNNLHRESCRNELIYLGIGATYFGTLGTLAYLDWKKGNF